MSPISDETLHRVDRWWTKTVNDRRYDHGPMYASMIVGLFCLGISMSIRGPSTNSTISSLAAGVQNFLAIMLVIGAAMSLVGSASGSRFFFPHWPRRKSYRWGIAGAPILCSCLAVYSIAIFSHVPDWTSALGGVLAPLLMIGIGVNAFWFMFEIRRIERNAETIVAIRNQKDSSDNG